MLQGYGSGVKIVNNKKAPELANELRMENQGGFGTNVYVDAGVVKLEYQGNGCVFEENLSCGIVFVNMMYGVTSWTADRMVAVRSPKGKLEENSKLFITMLKSFRLDLKWYNMYSQYVQALVQYKLQDIYNQGLISRIISNTYHSISDTVRQSYEKQQAAYDRVYAGISEGTRGVNTYHDLYKGYGVEVPNDYRYVYANALGEYIVTNNPNENPNIGSNLTWTLLNRV